VYYNLYHVCRGSIRKRRHFINNEQLASRRLPKSQTLNETSDRSLVPTDDELVKSSPTPLLITYAYDSESCQVWLNKQFFTAASFEGFVPFFPADFIGRVKY
jgi:hypothetical protein